MEQLKAMCPVCTLIKSDGTRCGSPALTGMNFCFQHIGGKVPKPEPETRRTNTPLDFIYPSNHEAIQSTTSSWSCRPSVKEKSITPQPSPTTVCSALLS